MNIEKVDKTELAWLVGVHMTFVVSGVLLALMDYLVEVSHSKNKAAKYR